MFRFRHFLQKKTGMRGCRKARVGWSLVSPLYFPLGSLFAPGQVVGHEEFSADANT